MKNMDKTQAQLAGDLGVSTTAVNLYLKQGILPKNKNKAKKMAKLLGVISSQPVNNKEQLELEVQMLSQKAKQSFNLGRDPFTEDVQNTGDVFLSSEQRYIRETLHQTAKFGGFLAIVGESGSGKSTLRRDLIERVRTGSDNISIIQPQTIDKTRLTAGSICDAIIEDISTERPKRTLEAKARQVQRLLAGSSRAGNSHCLIIEEAHDITVPVLKYLKRFWELEDGFKKLLSIILVGQLELKLKLDIHQNWDAREVIRRIEVAELRPLDEAIRPYLDLKFKRIGAANPLSDDAYQSILERLTISQRGSNQMKSMAYPLIVNGLITNALNAAAELGLDAIDANVIQEV